LNPKEASFDVINFLVVYDLERLRIPFLITSSIEKLSCVLLIES